MQAQTITLLRENNVELLPRNIVANLYMSAGMTIMMSLTMAIPMLLVSQYNSYENRGRGWPISSQTWVGLTLISYVPLPCLGGR